MPTDYWQKQATENPLFPDLLWSRPEHKAQAGKLLIVGGNAHGFSNPAEAYMHTLKAGAGTVRVIMPDAVQKLAGSILPEIEFAPSTPSGSFSRMASAEILAAATWADGILLAGNFGQNSETAILLESILTKHKEPITITKDAADIVIHSTMPVPKANRLYVLNMAQLQKLAIRLHVKQAYTLNMDFLQLVEGLHELTEQHDIAIIVKHLDQYVVARRGMVSTTKAQDEAKKWLIEVATRAAVWWLQNPAKPFEALTTAVYEFTK